MTHKVDASGLLLPFGGYVKGLMSPYEPVLAHSSTPMWIDPTYMHIIVTQEKNILTFSFKKKKLYTSV